MVDFDVDSLISELGISDDAAPAVAATTAQPAQSIDHQVDSLMSTLGIASQPGTVKPIACAGPGAMAGRGGACAGPGAMAGRGGACAGPGALAGRGVACAGPGAMAGRGGACAGPGAMAGRGGAVAGPGGLACAGPGAMRNASGPGSQFTPAQQTPLGQKITFTGPPCSLCGEPIVGRVFAVGDKKFHPQCFQCTHCHRVVLETEEFMEEKGDLYCQDCYYDLFGERCYGCKAPILDKCIRFEERAYHPEHFACAECGMSLMGVEYKEDEGDPLCMKCKTIRVKVRETKNEICSICKKPILGEYIILNGQKIHPEHYRCESCGCEFMGGNCKEHDGKNYCYECYEKLIKSVCAGCGKPIQGRSLTAIQRTWHPECLGCHVCSETFVQGKYFEHEGKAYCQFHFYKMFGKVCPRCQKVVEDDGISALSQLWHPACFTCHGCSKPLKGAVYDYESKPLCKSCFGKLPKNVRIALEEKMEARKKFEKEEAKRKKAELKTQTKAAEAAAKAKQ